MNESGQGARIGAVSVGWAFMWLCFRNGVLGESVFGPVQYSVGYPVYIASVGSLCVSVVVLAFARAPLEALYRSRIGVIAIGIAAAISLGAIPLISSTVPISTFSTVLKCAFSVVHGVLFSALFVLWAMKIRELCVSAGLTKTLVALLIAMAASFLILPNDFRFTGYGRTVILVASPMASAALALCRFEAVSSEKREPRSGLARVYRNVVLLSLFAVLVYMIAFARPVKPGFVELLPENPIGIGALFLLILVLVCLLFYAEKRSLFKNDTYLYVFSVLAFAAFAVLFALVYAEGSGSDFPFFLVDLLQRIVPIVVFLVLCIVVYRNGLDAVFAFSFALLLPFSACELVRISLSVAFPGFPGNTLLFLALLGFLMAVCWSAYLLLFNSGAITFFIEPFDEGPDESASASSQRIVSDLADRCGLTDRETEVLTYLACGYSVQRISEVLFISRNTAKSHIASIYRKTDLHTKQEIIDLIQR